jgi:hypothetical protein
VLACATGRKAGLFNCCMCISKANASTRNQIAQEIARVQVQMRSSNLQGGHTGNGKERVYVSKEFKEESKECKKKRDRTEPRVCQGCEEKRAMRV